jgi:hypothetical protein
VKIEKALLISRRPVLNRIPQKEKLVKTLLLPPKSHISLYKAGLPSYASSKSNAFPKYSVAYCYFHPHIYGSGGSDGLAPSSLLIRITVIAALEPYSY